MIPSAMATGGRCEKCRGRAMVVVSNGRYGVRVMHRAACSLAPVPPPEPPAPATRSWWRRAA